jgi:hypothetical protein
MMTLSLVMVAFVLPTIVLLLGTGGRRCVQISKHMSVAVLVTSIRHLALRGWLPFNQLLLDALSNIGLWIIVVPFLLPVTRNDTFST